MKRGGLPVTARPARLSWLGLVAAGLVLAGSFVLAVTVGAAGLDPGSVIRELLGLGSSLTDVERSILYEIRLPRAVMGALVGAVLAVGGAAYQGVFRNALADPYLLGVAAGAGLGATIALAITRDSVWLAPMAFVGASLAVLATFALGRSVAGRSPTALILAGVAVSAFATAAQTYLLQRDAETLREVYSWILGRLSTVGWSEVLMLLPYAFASLLVLLGSMRMLDVLSIGDEEATALGVRVDRVRALIVAAATLATAAAVSVSGLIGFVGIIVPHTIRLLFGWSYRVIVPVAILLGAAFLVLADVAARTVVSPGELPIGVVTAFLGAPFFLIVLRTMRGPA